MFQLRRLRLIVNEHSVFGTIYGWGRRVIGIFGSLTWSKTLIELIFNPCGEFPLSTESLVSQINSPHLHVTAPRVLLDLLSSVKMLNREWGAESNRKLPLLFIPGKTTALVPEFTVEDLPSAELQFVLCACSEEAALGQNTLMMMFYDCNGINLFVKYPWKKNRRSFREVSNCSYISRAHLYWFISALPLFLPIPTPYRTCIHFHYKLYRF